MRNNSNTNHVLPEKFLRFPVYVKSARRTDIPVHLPAVQNLQPLLFRTWPAWADVFMSGAVMAGLAINAVRWHLKETMEVLA